MQHCCFPAPHSPVPFGWHDTKFRAACRAEPQLLPHTRDMKSAGLARNFMAGEKVLVSRTARQGKEHGV